MSKFLDEFFNPRDDCFFGILTVLIVIPVALLAYVIIVEQLFFEMFLYLLLVIGVGAGTILFILLLAYICGLVKNRLENR